MSVADAKAALKACEDGIALITAQQKSNQVLTDDYNDKLRAWESRRNAANNEWDRLNTQRQNSQRDWDNRFKDILRRWADEKVNAGCGGCGTNPGCWSGWREVGQHGCGWLNGQCEHECRRNGDLAQSETFNQIKREKGDRPGDYNEPKFSEGKPEPPAQNLTSIDLACCANVSNIVGSQVDQTIINQQNNCLQDKRSEIEKAIQQEAAAEKAAAEKEAFEKAAAEKVAAQKVAAQKVAKVAAQKVLAQKASAQKEKDNLTIVIGGTGIIFIFCISIILVILLLVLSE